VFTTGPGAKDFLELNQNIPSGDELGILAPDGFPWFVVFEFDEVGYVKDDEKGSLDAKAMLETIQRGTENANKEKKRRGWTTVSVVGWIRPPHFDNDTHNLEWALALKGEEGGLTANHNTRYLGRRGVMRVNLVVDSNEMDKVLPEFRKVMRSFHYTPDNSYRAFVKGDKIAEYGLTALVVGGAAAAASKTGLLKSMWKLLVAGVLGIGALIRKLLGSRNSEENPEVSS